MRKLLIFIFLLISSPALSQEAKPGQSFGFVYSDTDLKNYSITKFEMSIDSGAWTNIKLPPSSPAPPPLDTDPDKKEYTILIPPLTPGDHNVRFRACNSALCSDPTVPLNFSFVVVLPVPSGVRIK